MAAPNSHRNGFARKKGRRPVETGACRAPRVHRLRRIPGREAGGHARTPRQIPGTLRSRLLPRPPRTRETTENPPPNGPTARQRSPAPPPTRKNNKNPPPNRPPPPSTKPPPFFRSRTRQGAVPRLNRGTLWVRR